MYHDGDHINVTLDMWNLIMRSDEETEEESANETRKSS